MVGVFAMNTEKIMAVTAQFNQYQSTISGKHSGGLVSRLMTRMLLNCEARAIHRLEVEAGHLLGADELRHIKAEFAARKARANL